MAPKTEINTATDPENNLGIIPQTEAAVMLGVSRKTMQNWYAARKGPASVKIGWRVFYRRAALIEWIESQERPTDMNATVKRGRGRPRKRAA